MNFFKKKDQEDELAGIEAVVQGNTKFALDLYQELRSSEGNLFYSPYSISSALAMTCAGAQENTQKEMAQALHFSVDQETLHPAFERLSAGLIEAGDHDHLISVK